MSYKTILTILDTPDNADIAIDHAFALAARHGAHVIGMHTEIIANMPMVAPMEIPDPVAVQALQDMARKEALHVRQRFEQKCAEVGDSFEWRGFSSSVGYSSKSLIESARSADIVVAVQPDPADSSDAHVDIESFLMEIGRPVLMVPHVFPRPKPIRRILVAWNRSREATRAVFDAMPFLKEAESVEIFSVNPAENRPEPTAPVGTNIAATLKRHGINVTITPVAGEERSASQLIEARVADTGIDLLVMGAYTHSRFWQTLFGGTTKTVLKSMSAMTLLSR